MGPMNMVFLLIVGLALLSIAHGCPGCPENQDVNSPLVHGKLVHFLSKASSPRQIEGEKIVITKITKATTQVVSGWKYTYDFEVKGLETQNIYECHLVVISQPWLRRESVEDYHCLPKEAIRNKRSIPGAEIEIEDTENDGHLTRIQKYIADKLNNQQKSKYLMGVVKFYKASKKVVSGLLFNAKVEVAETDCLVGATNSQEMCTFQRKGHQVCNVQVWEKPWLQKAEVKLLECSEIPHYCPGCPVDSDPEGELVNQCLRRALFKLNIEREATTMSLRRITKVKTQVVAGLKYTIEFETEDEEKSVYNCSTVILSQPWLSDEPSVLEFQCSPAASRQ